MVQNLSVAVLINRAALAASLGGKPSADAISAQVHEIEQLVASAAGLNRERGDAVKVAIVDFVDSSHDLEPAPGPSLVEIVARQAGSIFNAGAIVAVAGMLLWFGVRPAMKLAFVPPRVAAIEDIAQLIRQSRPRIRGDGRRQSARRKHPHRDRSGPRRIHAGAARAAR